jgi:hypothetical protein
MLYGTSLLLRYFLLHFPDSLVKLEKVLSTKVPSVLV